MGERPSYQRLLDPGGGGRGARASVDHIDALLPQAAVTGWGASGDDLDQETGVN